MCLRHALVMSYHVRVMCSRHVSRHVLVLSRHVLVMRHALVMRPRDVRVICSRYALVLSRYALVMSRPRDVFAL